VLVADLTEDQLARVPPDFIQFGKIPAGRLLEAVGAKGAAKGDAFIADYHANLVLNRSRATSQDIVELTSEYAERVFNRFGIRLEPEILIL
jgi:UDP-N-acetylmuramate dehydrogenase